MNGLPTATACPCCGKSDTVMLRYIGTAYTADAANFVASCRECFEDIWNNYQEMWAEYYDGRYRKAPPPVGIYETM